MKKIISVLLIVIMVLTMFGCGEKKPKVEDSLVVGKWYSPNRSDVGHDVDYTIYFYEDGSAKETWRSTAVNSTGENTFKWTVSGDVVKLKHLLLGAEYTYVIEDGVEKLMASQADGYWYEHIVE